ncbi:MAG: GNAT family N-acetyltransferase [Phycisphaerae bacterium]
MTTWRVEIGSEATSWDEVVEFLARIFGPNYYDARFAQQTVLDHEPSRSPGNLFLARGAKEELVGLVRVVERRVGIGGTALTGAGISSVAVHPAWREQGVASALIRAAIENATARGMAFAFLHGRRAMDRFYLKYGFYGIGRYVDLELLSAPPAHPHLDVRPFEPSHLPLCMRSYQETYSPLAGSVVRDPPVWAYLLKRADPRLGGFDLRVCTLGRVPVGYLVLAGGKLVEAAVPGEALPGVPGLLRTLGAASISVHPRHSLTVYCRTHVNTVYKERFALDGGYMARLLDVRVFLSALGPVWAARAASAGAGNRVIRILGHAVDLGTGMVTQESGPDDLEFERPESAVRVLLGVNEPGSYVGVRWPASKPWIWHVLAGTGFHTSAWDEV